jgi:hypothetical protein
LSLCGNHSRPDFEIQNSFFDLLKASYLRILFSGNAMLALDVGSFVPQSVVLCRQESEMEGKQAMVLTHAFYGGAGSI